MRVTFGNWLAFIMAVVVIAIYFSIDINESEDTLQLLEYPFTISFNASAIPAPTNKFLLFANNTAPLATLFEPEPVSDGKHLNSANNRQSAIATSMAYLQHSCKKRARHKQTHKICLKFLPLLKRSSHKKKYAITKQYRKKHFNMHAHKAPQQIRYFLKKFKFQRKRRTANKHHCTSN